MVTGDRNDPYKSFNFLIEVGELIVGGFTEVSGLSAEIEVHKFREGGLNEYEHQLPGPTKFPNNLVLKRGLTDADEMWGWFMDVGQGIIERKNGSIILKDDAGEEKWRWNFVGAYPVRWIGPSLRAGAAEIAVETLELVHNGLAKA